MQEQEESFRDTFGSQREDSHGGALGYFDLETSVDHRGFEEEANPSGFDAEEPLGSNIFRAYFDAVCRFRKVIILFWLAFFLWGLITGPKFLSKATVSFDAPKGSLAYEAEQIFKARFPVKANARVILILIRCRDTAQVGCDVRTQELAQWHFELADSVRNFSNSQHGGSPVIGEIMSWYDFNRSMLMDDVKTSFITPSGNSTFISYMVSQQAPTKVRYTVVDMVREAANTRNPNRDMYAIEVTGSDPIAKDGSESAMRQLEIIDSFTLPFAFGVLAYIVRSWRLLLLALFNLGTVVLGSFAIMVLYSNATGRDPDTTTSSFLEVISLSTSIDYSLFILKRFHDEKSLGRDNEGSVYITMLQAGHIVVMSAATLICVFLGFVMLPAQEVKMIGEACSISIAICVIVNITNTPAMLLQFPRFFGYFPGATLSHVSGEAKLNIQSDRGDYNPFEYNGGHMSEPLISVDEPPITRNGPTGTTQESADARHISTSGSSMSAASNLPNLYGRGVRSTPTFPSPFASPGGNSTVVSSPRTPSAQEFVANPMSFSPHIPIVSAYLDTQGENPFETDDVHPMYKGLRFKITKYITEWPRNIVVIIGLYVLVIPLATQAFRLKSNQDVLQGIPRDSSSGHGFRHFEDYFPSGTLSPFYIIVDTTDLEPSSRSLSDFATGRTIDGTFFRATNEVVKRITNETSCPSDNVQSVARLQGRSIPIQVAKTLRRIAPWCKRQNSFLVSVVKDACKSAAAYSYLWDQSVNEQQTTGLITILAPFMPLSSHSKPFIDKIQSIVADVNQKYESKRLRFYLTGEELVFSSEMDETYGTFPILIGACLGTVFLLLALMFRSAFVPVRLAATLVLPLAGVYGLAVLVFQSGILNWTGWQSVHSRPDGFYWYIPMLTFVISIGLALDYDIFIVGRIMEHRQAGYEIRAAIVKAVCETGGTISAAGIIMCLVFSGMLFSTQAAVDELGWILTTSVLFDTFVVNTLLVPSLMSLADHISWWPTQMPTQDLITLEDREFTSL